MLKVLVVEDDENFNQIVCQYLRENQFIAVGCLNALTAYDAMYDQNFDLIITDVMMPDVDGVEFAQTIRGVDEQIPILFVTARDDFKTKQDGFRIGIDDYMVKPIDIDELILRIHAILRRSHIAQSQQVQLGGFLMDADSRSVTYQGQEVAMTVREFDILYKLLSYPNRAFSRSQLLDEFWDIDSSSSLRSVDVYITKIRDKVKMVGEFHIKTIHGLGYKVVMNNG